MLTGDQGFLNSYYSGFPNAHVFEPGLPPDVRNSRPVPEMERLSTLYNADVGLYMLANKVLILKIYEDAFLLYDEMINNNFLLLLSLIILLSGAFTLYEADYWVMLSVR